MGTRNLTMVVMNGETKIAQYGQWDGYPSGQGTTCLNFLHSADLTHFKEQLKKVKFIDEQKQEEIDKFMESIGSDNGWMTGEQADKYHEKYPLLTRDNGAKILNLVNKSTDSEMWLHNNEAFAGDGLFCEWGYVIDFDKNTFEVYKGSGKTPLVEEDRFFKTNETSEGEYYGVKMIKSYNLSELPTVKDFIKELEKSDEEK